MVVTGAFGPFGGCLLGFSRAPKSRAADDLVMVCELHAAHAEARAELPLLTTRELIAIATSQEAVEKRALALWYALGTDRRPTGLVSRPSLSSASAKKAALAAPFERFSNRFRASANERTTTSLNYGMDTLKLAGSDRLNRRNNDVRAAQCERPSFLARYRLTRWKDECLGATKASENVCCYLLSFADASFVS